MMNESASLTSIDFAKFDKAVKDGVFTWVGMMGWSLEPHSKLSYDWPLVASPTPVLMAVGVYLLIVGSALLKNAYMPSSVEPAKASGLFRLYILLHNAFLGGLSLYMCVTTIKEAIANKYTLSGNLYKETEVGMARVIYIFYLSKFYEFFDTFIMLAKGSYRQVSVLHVYHHSSVAFLWWIITYYAPGGDAYFCVAMNTWVHVVMYSYYLCSALLEPEARKKYLWWGKHLTQMQMLQFVLNLLPAIYYLIADTGHQQRFLSELMVVYMLSLIGLFGHFYMQRWAKGSPKVSKSKIN